MFYLTLNYQFSYNCDDVKQSIPAQEETLTNYISEIQECTSSDCTPVCAIGCFDFSLPTNDEKRKCAIACIAVLGSVLVALPVIGVALLGWSSFAFNTIQGNG